VDGFIAWCRALAGSPADRRNPGVGGLAVVYRLPLVSRFDPGSAGPGFLAVDERGLCYRDCGGWCAAANRRSSRVRAGARSRRGRCRSARRAVRPARVLSIGRAHALQRSGWASLLSGSVSRRSRGDLKGFSRHLWVGIRREGGSLVAGRAHVGIDPSKSSGGRSGTLGGFPNPPRVRSARSIDMRQVCLSTALVAKASTRSGWVSGACICRTTTTGDISRPSRASRRTAYKPYEFTRG
jgi:hypothetical protein